MSLVVSHYNPWKEQMAVGVLGNLLNRWLDARAERERNKGMNEAIAAAGGTLNPENAEQGLGGLQTGQDGLNNASWENRAVNNNSALPNFDMNTGALAGLNNLAGVMGATGNSVTNDVPVSNPNKVGRSSLSRRPDFATMHSAALKANPYFDPQKFSSIMFPVMQNQQSWYDAQEQRAREQAGWDAAMGMSDKNLAPLEFLRNGGSLDVAKFMDSIWNPELKLSTIDGGGTIYSNTFNPRTGEQKEIGQTQVTMTPYQAEQIALGKDRNAISREELGLRRAALARSGGGGGTGKINPYFYTDENGNLIAIDKGTLNVYPMNLKGKASGSGKQSLSPEEVAINKHFDSQRDSILKQPYYDENRNPRSPNEMEQRDQLNKLMSIEHSREQALTQVRQQKQEQASYPVISPEDLDMAKAVFKQRYGREPNNYEISEMLKRNKLRQ